MENESTSLLEAEVKKNDWKSKVTEIITWILIFSIVMILGVVALTATLVLSNFLF